MRLILLRIVENKMKNFLMMGMFVVGLTIASFVQAEGGALAFVAHTDLALVPAQDAIVPGETLTVALRMKLDPGWHTYWQHPGDSGMAVGLDWHLPEGLTAGPIQWPYPHRMDEAGLTTYAYEDEVWLFTDVNIPSNFSLNQNVTMPVDVRWLMCKELCLPGRASLTLTLPVQNVAQAHGTAETGWQKARLALPRSLQEAGWQAQAAYQEGRIQLRLWAEAYQNLIREGAIEFFPLQADVIDHAAPQIIVRRPNEVLLTMMSSEFFNVEAQKRLQGVVVISGKDGATSYALDVPTSYALDVPLDRGGLALDYRPVSFEGGSTQGRATSLPLVQVLLMAFVGGLILNLMPCVFPVLGIKVLQLIRHAGEDRAVVRRHVSFFTFGVLTMFWALAGLLILLKGAGHAIGWGFQFQSPLFVIFLAGLFLVLALNLFGLFEMGTGFMRWSGSGTCLGQSSHGHAFFSGLLTTLVATPCTAPFMGTALGVALTQPAWWALLVFTALGLGMAMPVVVLSLSPALLRRLPKPGPWMGHLRNFFGLLFMLTTVWLVWLLGLQRGQGAMVGLLSGLGFVILAVLALGKGDVLNASASTRWRARLMAVLFLGIGIALAMVGLRASSVKDGIEIKESSSSMLIPWQPYSAQTLAALRQAGTPVFLNFTASWCLSCQVNARLVFQNPEVIDYFKTRGIVALKADWTNYDAEVTHALENLGKTSIPVYVYYPSGNASPVILPELITPATFFKYLNKD